VLHELFCPRAATFMSVTMKATDLGHTNNPWSRAKGQVMLQVMHIPALRKKCSSEVVLCDSATDTNYVRLGHAKHMGLPQKTESAVISMVGGAIQIRTLPVFEC